jgi:hydroxymethylbilane synthase
VELKIKMADKIIRIGTRDSELALWQAHTVEKAERFGV